MTKKELRNKMIIMCLLSAAAGGLAILGGLLATFSLVVPSDPIGWIVAAIFIVAGFVVANFADKRRNDLVDKISGVEFPIS